ncbi:hypothetical protein DMW38_10345 [Vibrio parahaemolyticus]|nr:hypothetical protein [Vibrio parahaemolyticus]
MLEDAWSTLLNENGLMDLALQKSTTGAIGGESTNETNQHLATRYNGSCARVVLSILDPKHEMDLISDTYATLFAGNRVFLADIPSGSGAAIMSILCTLAELRDKLVIPRHPLEVVIVAGEISQVAIGHMARQLELIKPMLEAQAITIVDVSLKIWDVECKQSTAKLIREMTIKSIDCDNRMLILCNFSGYLDSGRWKKTKSTFEEVFRHSTDTSSAAIWIEPQTKKAETLFENIRRWFDIDLSYFLPSQKQVKPLASKVDCMHTFGDGSYRVQLKVHRFDLPDGV